MHTTIKRIARSVLAALLFLLILAGCSNQSAPSQDEASEAVDAAAAAGEQAADTADAASDTDYEPAAASDEVDMAEPPPAPPAPPHPYPASPDDEDIAADEPSIPEFPTTPPKPTTTYVMGASVLGNNATLGDIARKLDGALDKVGYSDRKYYAFPGGFALATRLEQISSDGTPRSEPSRWSAGLPSRPVRTITEFIHVLLTAPEGHYRVLVFIVTPQGFTTSDRPATGEMAEKWIAGGWNLLPDSVAMRSAMNAKCTVLVYQFRKRGHEQPKLANPDGAPSAKQHLEKTGILAALNREEP